MHNSNGFVAAYVRKQNPSLSVLRTAKELGLTDTTALYRFFKGQFHWLGVAKQEHLAKLLSSKRRKLSVHAIKRDIERRKGASSESSSQ